MGDSDCDGIQLRRMVVKWACFELVYACDVEVVEIGGFEGHVEDGCGRRVGIV